MKNFYDSTGKDVSEQVHEIKHDCFGDYDTAIGFKFADPVSGPEWLWSLKEINDLINEGAPVVLVENEAINRGWLETEEI